MYCPLRLRILLVTAALLTVFTACHKKTPQAAPVETAPVATADTNATAAAPAEAPPPPPQKPLDMAPVQTAIRTGDYDKAAADLLALQRLSAQMNAQQQAAVADQMRAFQRTLATALGSGDPKAMAAAQRLRAASMHH